MDEATHALFDQIVLGGILTDIGMISFSEVLDQQKSHDIQNYLIDVSNNLWNEQQDGLDWLESVKLFTFELIADIVGWSINPSNNE